MVERDDGTDAVSQGRARIEQALSRRSTTSADLCGGSGEYVALEWISLPESEKLVRHWTSDLGATRFGRGGLALLPPATGYSFDELSGPGDPPSWLVKSANSVFLIFSDYRTIGIARCSWKFVQENLFVLAVIDGNGYAAVLPELTGVVLVDLELDDEGYSGCSVEVQANYC